MTQNKNYSYFDKRGANGVALYQTGLTNSRDCTLKVFTSISKNQLFKEVKKVFNSDLVDLYLLKTIHGFVNQISHQSVIRKWDIDNNRHFLPNIFVYHNGLLNELINEVFPEHNFFFNRITLLDYCYLKRRYIKNVINFLKVLDY